MKTIVKKMYFKTLTIVVIFLFQIPDPNKMKNYKYNEGLNLESCFGWVGSEVANRSLFNKCGGK
jgi:hypothetical protein